MLRFAKPQALNWLTPGPVASTIRPRLAKRSYFMSIDSVYSDLTLKNGAKMALLVMDGLGDIATAATDYKTPLEAAATPNLDVLAKDSALGRLIPAAHGITPGSGPGHLGLFGYDPLEVEVGRGVIEALGLGLELQPGDVAARANFCTLDADGLVTDRRAGRIETELCEERCAKLTENIKQIGDAEIIITPGKKLDVEMTDHR